MDRLADYIHTITFDRGSEFAEDRRLERSLKAAIYFADPHSPWQRGCNENLNGLLPQYFPRSRDLDHHHGRATSRRGSSQRQAQKEARLPNPKRGILQPQPHCTSTLNSPGITIQPEGEPPSLSAPLFKVCALQSLATRQGKAGNDQRRPAFHQIPLEPFPELGHAEADRRTTPMPEVLRSPALARASRWQCRGGHVVRQLRERDPGQRRSHFHVGIVGDEWVR